MHDILKKIDYRLLSLFVTLALSVSTNKLCSVGKVQVVFRGCILTCHAAENTWGWDFNLVCPDDDSLVINCINNDCYYIESGERARNKFCGITGYTKFWIDAPIEGCESEVFWDQLLY
jgi:hypothetical protein